MVLTKVARLELKGELRLILLQHQGRGQAVTGKKLARMLGYRSDRQIRLVIRELIRDGLPVASITKPPAGYFLASSRAEANEYADSIKGRLIEDAYRRRDFRRAANLYLKSTGQWRLL